MKTLGYIKSELDGMELLYDTNPDYRIHVPENYRLIKLGPIRDQGNKPICVSVCLTDMIRWRKTQFNSKYTTSDSAFYYADVTAGKLGMQPKKAFEILVNNKEMNYNPDIPKIYSVYAKVESADSMKRAIIGNGPLMACIGVKDTTRTDFWNGNDGMLIGGHAVLFTGFTKEGFILRNSWGCDYGDSGYSIFPYSDLSNIMESWTLIR